MERLITLNARLAEMEPQANQHESEINAIVQELSNSPITLAMLQHTKIGLTVNKVRKALPPASAANQAAVKLIVLWKEVAKMAMAAAASTAAPVAAGSAVTPPGAAAAATVTPAAAKPASAVPSPASAAAASVTDAKKRKADGPAATSAAGSSVKGTDPKRAKTASTLAAPVGASSSARNSASSPMRSASPGMHASPPTISLASLAAAQPPLPVPPPATLLYNPNLQYYRDRARAEAASKNSAAAANREIDYTSRKVTGRGTGGVDAFMLAPQTPNGSTAPLPPVQLCSLLDMCADHVALHLDRIPGSYLDAIPVPICLRVLAKATEAQLHKFEAANSSLLGETEQLWHALCRRSHPGVPDSEKPASSTWKAWHAQLAKRKDDKMAALQARLRGAMQNAEAEKAGSAIKTINQAAAMRIENKGKMQTAQATAAAAKQTPRLSLAAIKQQTKSFSKATWSAR